MTTIRCSTPYPLVVWMDGNCSVCRASQTWCEVRDEGDLMCFRDFRAADENTLPLSREDHEASMWVRDGDGRLHRGFAAWRLIMATLPGWRWLATLTGLPPFRWLGEPCYRLIANNRHRIARWTWT